MFCPFCQHGDTRVIDSRVSEDGATIRRRRECEACGERFSTLEVVELKLPVIVKSDGRREAFDARKLRVGFDRALQKRPVSEEQIEAAVRAVVHQLRMAAEREVATRKIGEFVMAELRKLDHVGLCGLPRCIAASRTWRTFARKSKNWNVTCRPVTASCRSWTVSRIARGSENEGENESTELGAGLHVGRLCHDEPSATTATCHTACNTGIRSVGTSAVASGCCVGR